MQHRSLCTTGVLVVGLLGAGYPSSAASGDHAIARSAAEPVPGPTISAAAAFVSRVTEANLVASTVTNYGFLGNNFVSRSPSLEYPHGSGFEHMVNGGLWFGARTADGQGAFTGVTTGTLDIGQGGSTSGATEFTPSGDTFIVRSTRSSSPFFHPLAVSEEDLIADYDDLTAKRANGNPEDHRPLGIRVRQSVYAWSLEDYQDVLFYRFVVTSVGQTLSDAWIGLNVQFASGPKNAYSTWPPSSAGSPLGSWYGKAWLEYDASDRLLREHYCAGQPVPAGCNLSLVPHWIGLKLLTPPNPVMGQQVTVAAWNWSPGDFARDTDVERYALMSAGSIVDLGQFVPGIDDPVELIALGPFPTIAPGDSVVVDFALVGGGEVSDIRAHAADAQALYDMGYAIGTTPTQLSLYRAEAEPDRVRLVWHAIVGAGSPMYVERREEFGIWQSLGEATSDASGLIAFEDLTVEAGRTYAYRAVLRSGREEQHFDEVWVDVPHRPEFGLLVLRPHPATAGNLVVDLSLAHPDPATIEMFDVNGRIVLESRLEPLRAGNHSIRLEEAGQLTPGMYWVRLTQGARQATKRAILVR